MPIQYTISFFVILLLNIVFNRIIPTYYLSLQGEKERLKIQEFKNYLEKYSIIEERKLEEIVIWDKYLVYAIALGITNKIPKKIYETYMNININLQRIENIINIL